MKTADYYDAAADYTGVVQEIANEINGLTLDGFRRWYYSGCEDFYYRRVVQLASPDRAVRVGRRKKGKFLPPFEGEKSVRADRLAQRLVSRLYVLRKLRVVRNTFTLFFDEETALLARRHARHLDRALDKKLYLAERLSELSQELHPFVRMLRDARAGNTWLSKLSFEFDPRPLANEPRAASQNLARTLHFRVLLAEYESQHVEDNANGLADKPLADARAFTTQASPSPIEFGSYLKPDCQEQLLPFLKKNYTEAKTQKITCMLYALNDLGLLTTMLSDINQTELHESIKHFFCVVSTRQALNTSINNFNRASGRQQQTIEQHRSKIKEYLKPT